MIKGCVVGLHLSMSGDINESGRHNPWNNFNQRDHQKSDHFVDSIEEEIRDENLQRMWQRYGKLVIYTVFTILISVTVYNMWQRQDLSEREAIASKFILVQNAIMSGNNETALSELRALSNASKKDYATLAKFEYAAILRDKEQPDALAEYKSIYEDKKVNEIMRNLAYIFYVSSAIDLMSTKEISKNIDNFTEELKKNHVGKYWDLLAKETLAFCYIKKGDNKMAKEALEALAKTAGIPANMAERTKILLNSIED